MHFSSSAGGDRRRWCQPRLSGAPFEAAAASSAASLQHSWPPTAFSTASGTTTTSSECGIQRGGERSFGWAAELVDSGLRRTASNVGHFNTPSAPPPCSEYRHVVLPQDIAKRLPKDKLLSEAEWRALGVQQSRGWGQFLGVSGVGAECTECTEMLGGTRIAGSAPAGAGDATPAPRAARAPPPSLALRPHFPPPSPAPFPPCSLLFSSLCAPSSGGLKPFYCSVVCLRVCAWLTLGTDALAPPAAARSPSLPSPAPPAPSLIPGLLCSRSEHAIFIAC